MFSYAVIVLETGFLLHKGEAINIAHIVVTEASTDKPFLVGGISLLIGLASFSATASPWLIAVFLFCSIVAFKYHREFKREFDALSNAKKKG